MSFEKIAVGDLVISRNGRSKGKSFITVDVKDGFAFIVDGKLRKVDNPKKKSVKHLKRVKGAVFSEIASQIKKGEPVGNKRVFKQIKAQTENV